MVPALAVLPRADPALEPAPGEYRAAVHVVDLVERDGGDRERASRARGETPRTIAGSQGHRGNRDEREAIAAPTGPRRAREWRASAAASIAFTRSPAPTFSASGKPAALEYQPRPGKRAARDVGVQKIREPPHLEVRPLDFRREHDREAALAQPESELDVLDRRIRIARGIESAGTRERRPCAWRRSRPRTWRRLPARADGSSGGRDSCIATGSSSLVGRSS